MVRFNFACLAVLCLLSSFKVNAQKASQEDFGPRISPDGNSVVYYSYRNDSLPDIYSIDLNTRKETQLTSSYKSWDLNPKWSKDGKEIYFSSDRNGDMAIFKMNSDGSHPKQITFPSKGNRHSEISFTANGKQMLYSEFRPDRITALILQDFETGTERLLLQSQKSGDEFFKPFIHPYEEHVVFLKNMGNDSSYIFDIFSLDIYSGKVTNITNTPDISERMPNWSDDGKYLVYSSNAQGNSFECIKTRF